MLNRYKEADRDDKLMDLLKLAASLEPRLANPDPTTKEKLLVEAIALGILL